MFSFTTALIYALIKDKAFHDEHRFLTKNTADCVGFLTVKDDARQKRSWYGKFKQTCPSGHCFGIILFDLSHPDRFFYPPSTHELFHSNGPTKANSPNSRLVGVLGMN